MADKKLQFTIGADNSPAIKALSELSVAMNKLNSGFKQANAAQRAAAKDKTKGSGTLFDEKELNSIGDRLKNVQGIIKTLTVSQDQWDRHAGFKDLKSGFDGVSDSAGFLFKTVSALLAPILTLTGAGVITGVTKLANAFGERSTGVLKSQFETGYSPKSIYKLQNQWQAAGIAPDATAATLTSFTQAVRGMALNASNGLLGTVQNQLGVKDIYQRYNNPAKREALLQEMMKATERVYKADPSAAVPLMGELGLTGSEPWMMLSDKQKKDAEAAANKAFLPNDKQLSQGREEDLSKHRMGLSWDSLTSKIGAHLTPLFSRIYNFSADTFSGDKLLDQHGINAMKGKQSFGDMFGDWLRPIDNLLGVNNPSVAGVSSGISLSGNAPREQTITLDVNINGAPPGTTVTAPPNQPVKVRSKINHVGFDQ
jgi:hypothetical protein